MAVRVLLLVFLAFSAKVSAVPLPDVVLYGSARLDSSFVSSGNIVATVNGQILVAAINSEGGIAYYSVRIPSDNSIGGFLRPGAILLDGPSAARTVAITIEGFPIQEGLIVLSDPGMLRLDISASSGACASARDDEGTRESAATLDYSDDYLEKTILLVGEPAAGTFASIWIYAQPYNYPGVEFVPQQDYYLEVNGDFGQQIWFDVGAELNYRDDIYQWFSLDVPIAWLQAGANTLYIREGGGLQYWEYNNLRVGVDTDVDFDRSWWYGNGVFACQFDPTGCTGELMIYVDVCTVGCGDGVCNLAETPCDCPADCGNPPATESGATGCADGVDNDCDGQTDCNDQDCELAPECTQSGIPTVSAWGMGVFAILLAGVATLVLRRRVQLPR